jgi:murein DD-endopeptidase MepM/ murein hydrolase activator NlpD
MIDGYDVPAIAAGKVVYSGSSALLGNFIVVDHGLGLKTWYCHLGNALSAPGEIVAKGEVIGKAGKTGYTNISGVYLITTVMDVPVSPYPMQDLGISFKNP